MSTIQSREAILLQAKAVILCGLPYRRSRETVIRRRAKLGPDTWLSVDYATTAKGVPIAYGADRALLAWIQTQAYPSGVVSFSSVTEFLDAFSLSRSGRHYEKFQQRLERLKALSIRVVVEDSSEEALVNTSPIKRAFTPKTRADVRAAATGQLSLISTRRYGFVVDPDFMRYFAESPVALPLKLMIEFKSNCMAWDFAQLVLWRCSAAKSPSLFPWDELLGQLGTSDTNASRVASKFRDTLETIREHYHDFPAVVADDLSGVYVSPWRPPHWRRVEEKERAAGALSLWSTSR